MSTFSALRIRSNDPVRPLLLAALAFAGYATLAKDFSLTDRWAAWLDRAGHGRIALLISCSVTIIAICYSATTGIVSDSYGYVSQADLWARGDLFIPEPHIAQAPWPEAERTFAPLGYRPVHSDGTWAYVPIYSAGLPLFMAAAKLVRGREFMFWIVPAFGSLLSWTTYANRPALWIDARGSDRLLAGGDQPARVLDDAAADVRRARGCRLGHRDLLCARTDAA
jgi:hypothetical protein